MVSLSNESIKKAEELYDIIHDWENPFSHLDIVHQELMHSSFFKREFEINRRLLQEFCRLVDAPYSKLKEIEKEKGWGGKRRLDIYIELENDWHILIENKVHEEIDYEQLKQYREEAKKLGIFPEKCKLVLLNVAPVFDANEKELKEKEWCLVTRGQLKKVIQDSYKGRPKRVNDYLKILEIFDIVEELVTASPEVFILNPEAIEKLQLSEKVKSVIKYIGEQNRFRANVYYQLFQQFRNKVNERTTDFNTETPAEQDFCKVKERGTSAMFFERPNWVNETLGVCFHYELKDNDMLAFHVETSPYNERNKKHIEKKTELAESLHEKIKKINDQESLDIDFRYCMKKNYQKHESTQIGKMPVDWEDMEGSVSKFIKIHKALQKLIEGYFP